MATDCDAEVITDLLSNLVSGLMLDYERFGRKCREFLLQQQERNPQLTTELAQSEKVKEAVRVYVPEKPKESKENRDFRDNKSVKDFKSVKSKDPDEIPAKRPRNAYNLFVASESVKIKEQFPHMRAPDIVRMAAERYNQMTPAQKQPYVDKFESSKRLYDLHNLGRAPVTSKRGRGRARSNYSLN